MSKRLLLCALLVLHGFAQATEDHHVLVLHSYHEGLSWTDDIQHGIDDALRESGLEVTLHVEYMGALRFRKILPSIKNDLKQALRTKFGGSPPAAIVVSDNEAFDFILAERDSLAPGVPILFCGINGLSNYPLTRIPKVTGVAEEASFGDTLNVMESLFPGRRILVIGDQSSTFRRNLEGLLAANKQRPHPFKADLLDDPVLSHIETRLRSLGTDTSVFFMARPIDEEGHTVPMPQAVRAVSAASAQPVFSGWEFMLGHGIVGGRLVSGDAQGRAVGKQLISVLRGTAVEAIPVQRESPNRYGFDYKQLERFGLQNGALPEGSMVIGRPTSFYETNRDKVHATILAFAILLVIVGLLVTENLRRKNTEKALKTSEERWKFALEGAGDGVWDWNILTGEALFSRRWKEMIGYAENEIEDRSAEWSNRVHPDDLPSVMATIQAHLEGRSASAVVEFRMQNKDGHWQWILSRGMVVSRDADGKPLRLVGTNTDITERKAAADKIEHLAFYDPLTDLPNRRLLLDRLEQALTSSARHNRYGALMLLDMDDFKTLNDTLGHDIGDQFLVEVARRLQACVREGDTVARHGGDEFVVILEDLNEDTLAAMQAESVAVKILRAVSQPYVLDLTAQGGLKNTRSYHCTSSIGITLFRDNSVSADELMKRADTAMYQAKAAGRDTLRFFDPEMQAEVAARAALDSDLREAMRDNQFCLYYQPQVDSAGNWTGAEALLRWQHPRRGMVSPVEFIPQSELTGMIIPLGHWVLETACAQLVAWEKLPAMAHLTVAVNVSARQFRHVDFVDQVLATIGRTGANPTKLKLELTESLLLESVEDVITKMATLKAAGISFSLDDFGTGYSSLFYLKRLPLDQLKIDQSFVRDVLTDPNDATIARTIVALAQSMGLAVIAEGVETEVQREFLAAAGCTAYQGYLFGRPMPIGEFSQTSGEAAKIA